MPVARRSHRFRHEASAGLCPPATPLPAHHYGRSTDLKGRALVGGLLACSWLMAWPAWAVEYRLQVTNVDYLTFSAYMGKATPCWRQNKPVEGLEARLDAQEFSPAAVLPGREVHRLEDPAYGGMVPARVSHLPATGRQPWTTYVFDGNPGDTVVFMVKSEIVAWQRVWAVATNAEGTLRRVALGGPALFGRQWREIPEVSYDFLGNAVDQGTFPRWVARRATAINGVSVVVGRGHRLFYNPDRVYIVIKLPPEPRTFKLVIGWEDHDNRGTNGGGAGPTSSRCRREPLALSSVLPNSSGDGPWLGWLRSQPRRGPASRPHASQALDFEPTQRLYWNQNECVFRECLLPPAVVGLCRQPCWPESRAAPTSGNRGVDPSAGST